MNNNDKVLSYFIKGQMYTEVETTQHLEPVLLCLYIQWCTDQHCIILYWSLFDCTTFISV